MKLLKAIGMVLFAFGMVGLVAFSVYLFLWKTFIVWMIVIFISLVVAMYYRLEDRWR